jgi:hypothetical protein
VAAFATAIHETGLFKFGDKFFHLLSHELTGENSVA